MTHFRILYFCIKLSSCLPLQRVLEHCHDLETQSKVMEEIMSTVSMLAQDQYGNYVIQVCKKYRVFLQLVVFILFPQN